MSVVTVVGGGRVGADLAARLSGAGHVVVVIERRDERAAALRATSTVATIMTGDGRDPNVLAEAGAASSDVLAAVTGDDASNLVVCALARFDLGVPRTIARVVDPVHRWLFDPWSGVDVLVDQTDLLARLITEQV